jgi:rhodanese-related sulfurtransferase
MTPRETEGHETTSEEERNIREATPVTIDEVRRLLEQGQPITFIDARNPIAWGSSKVKLPGAIRVPLDEVDRLLPRLPRDRRLIVYCT